MTGLVLSTFPGIGMLDMAFEEAGFCVVRGPDVLWGGDVRRFHPPAGRFDGVIGGPPCQAFSRLRHIVEANGYQTAPDLIPEYERVVAEAQPAWFLMENVPAAPLPTVDGYLVNGLLLNNRWLGEVQDRTRRFSFGTRDGRRLDVPGSALQCFGYRQAVTSVARAVPVRLLSGGKQKTTFTGDKSTLAEMCELQGLPRGFLADAPFTETAKRKAIGNGVPLPMGRAIAAAVIEAMR